MKLRYKYRIYPTKQQQQQMIAVGRSVRFVYNHFLKTNIDTYQQTKKFVWYNDMAKLLTHLKMQLPWLKDTYAQVLQQSLRDLDTALSNMKKMGAGFPCFKSKYTTPIRFRYQQGLKIIGNQIYLPKIGYIKIKFHRELPTYSSCTVIQTARGWYASFVVDVKENTLVSDISNPVGLDMNSDFIAMANISASNLIANPKPFKNKKHLICKLQQRLARKQKNSRNRTKAKQKLARMHDLIRCQRSNHIHQTSARIAKVYDLVSVETLKIEEMRRKSRSVAKAVADASWGQFISALEYKCQLQGHHFIKINQWLPSSKTCSNCGYKNNISLKQRTYHCYSCNYTQHRDINAAINIKNWGIQQWNLDHSGQELPAVPVDVICDMLSNYGDTSQTQLKQEVTT